MSKVLRRKAKEPQSVAMTERELMGSLRDAARQCGWLWYHTQVSLYSARGFPDVAMVKVNADGTARLAIWELKGPKGIVTEAQQVWLDALALVPGVDVRVVRPDGLEACYKYLAGIKE